MVIVFCQGKEDKAAYFYPNLMTPKQAEHLTQKITAIRRTLAAEKKKFGWYDDSRGLRYLPTRYYVQLGEFKGGLTYTRWFSKNFPDDVGFPDFLFEWTLLLFQNTKLKEAEQKAVETFCADRQLFDHFLARPITLAEPWEETPLAAASYATYFASLSQPTGLEKFAQWLATFLATEQFLARAAQYQHVRRQLHTEQARRKTSGARQPAPTSHLCLSLTLNASRRVSDALKMKLGYPELLSESTIQRSSGS